MRSAASCRPVRKQGSSPAASERRGTEEGQAVSDLTDHTYATQAEAFDEPVAPFAPQAGIGVSLSVGVFGFSVIMLGLAEARIFNPAAAGIFVPVALGLGATGLIFGGVFEMRANNVFAGTFSLLYARRLPDRDRPDAA